MRPRDRAGSFRRWQVSRQPCGSYTFNQGGFLLLQLLSIKLLPRQVFRSQGPPLSSRTRARTSHILPVAAVFCGCLTACGKSQDQQPAPAAPPQVGVVTVHAAAVPLTRDLVGRLSATRVSDVRARVPGILLKRLYKEGTEVK